MCGNHAEGHVVESPLSQIRSCGLSPVWDGASKGKMSKESVGDCGWLMFRGGSRC